MTRDGPADGSTDGSQLPTREQRAAVRRRYGSIAAGSDDGGCCGDEPTTTGESTCCAGPGAERSSDGADAPGCSADPTAASRSLAAGYSRADLERVAAGANLGLGCGNPTAIAGLEEGETVLDLGSGGGFDCLLAARAVGPTGRVIGVDMTPEMVERARANAEEGGHENVEFRLGEMEALPVPDVSVDVVISNCAINLSPAKRRVFEEAYRVLRPGGRLTVADVVLTADVPPERRADPESVARCVAGAATIDDLRAYLERAGFASVSVRPTRDGEAVHREWSGERPLEAYVTAAAIEGEKPREVAE